MRTLTGTRVPGKPPHRAPTWADFGLTPQELAWQERAACRHRGGGTFFPEPGAGEGVAAAKRMCAACPVRPQCLRHALDRKEPHGIWGGLTESERRVLTARDAG
jgi:WhiB family redox-sensing transcriptional regulator